MNSLNRILRRTAKVFVVVFTIPLILTACGLMPEKRIYTEINIQASPEKVWQVLVDNESYPSWNPYHVKVVGKLQEGAPLIVSIHKPNGARLEIEPKVMRLDRNKELTWGGGVPGIFTGEHQFILSRNADASTHLIHKELFQGWVVPFASLEAIEEGYRRMNEALKLKVEAEK